MTVGATCWIAPGNARAYDEPARCRNPAAPSAPGPWRDLESVDDPAPPIAQLCLRWRPPALDPNLGESELTRRLARARHLGENGRVEAAVLEYRFVADALPEIADRLALEEAELRMANTPNALACAAFERAATSPHRTVATRGELGLCRCHLAIGDRIGVAELDLLRRRYPELTERERLELALGQAQEAWGETEAAIATYRRLDLLAPGSPFSALARARLETLAASGVEVRPLNGLQLVERLERLVSSGPMDAARTESERLLTDATLSANTRQHVARSAARIARVEARWADAARYLRQAQGAPVLDPEEREEMAARVADLERANESRTIEDVRRRLRGVTRGQPLDGQGTARLFAALRLAVRGGLVEETNALLRAIVGRDRLPPGLQFDAAIEASGTGDDRLVASLFASARAHPRFGVAARYHHARALERLGQRAEARAELRQVIAQDSQILPYYALWARQRLRAITPRPSEPAAPEVAVMNPPPASADVTYCAVDPESLAAKVGEGDETSLALACRPVVPPPNPFDDDIVAADDAATDEEEIVDAPLAEADAAATEAEQRADTPDHPDIALTDEQIIALLDTLATDHGEAFPWFARARALVHLGEREAAMDELHEAYTAYHEATGQGSLRADLLGVLRGATPPRHRVTPANWRGRRTFPRRSQQTMATACAALGDYGLAIRLGGFDVAGRRPRAYEHLVEAAAARHGLEPEVLYAVMRVESVYNPRIISYASAIGLMQIMPRTGRLIADSLERDDFTVDQLLDPATNIDFAAWYLASLIERFEGRLPLAIASYNGGPHNVRRWMRDHGEHMTVDAFLETIPFEQTHRYVRRVLTHYEAYRAQRGLAPDLLVVDLPPPAVDRVAF